MDPLPNHLAQPEVWLSRADTPPVYRPQPLTPAPGPVGERRIVGYERYASGLVPVYEQQAPVQPAPPRDLTPRPVIDPVAQRLAAGGVLAIGVGVGGWLLFTPVAAICLGSLAVIVLALWMRRGEVHVHQSAGLFGHNTTNIN